MSAAPKQVDNSVRDALRGTKFEASSLRPLTGGIVNWGYVATLKTPLDDGTCEVFIKHGEKYMATIPDFPLDLERCVCTPPHRYLIHNSVNTDTADLHREWKLKSSPS
jgi:hypothetical protein